MQISATKELSNIKAKTVFILNGMIKYSWGSSDTINGEYMTE